MGNFPQAVGLDSGVVRHHAFSFLSGVFADSYFIALAESENDFIVCYNTDYEFWRPNIFHG